MTLGRDARARAIQLPAWNEALGLPRPWDQQWSLRIQQILAEETDLLEYPDIFEGSKVMDGLVAELVEAAKAEMNAVEEKGGAVEAVPYMKAQLVESNRQRIAKIERGDITVVGQNKLTESEESPLMTGEDGGGLTPDPEVERGAALSRRWRNGRRARDKGAVEAASTSLAEVARDESANILPATLEAARAGVTTGEWAGTLREIFGAYRAPTGIAAAGQVANGGDPRLDEVRAQVRSAAAKLGHPIKVLVGKPGLDGHSNGAEQIALACSTAGMEVIYGGIRLTPAEIVATACDESVDLVGLSILSGSHLTLVPEVLRGLRDAGGEEIPVVVGGIVPEDDARALRAQGVARIYTPKDFQINRIIGEIAELVADRHRAAQPA